MTEPEGSEVFQRWKQGFRRPHTWENWRNYFEGYREWRNMTHDQLYQERQVTFNNPDLMTKLTVEEKVKQYLKYLEETGLAPSTIRTALGAIKSFYNYSSYGTMRLNIVNLRMRKGLVIRSMPPTAEEIEKLLDTTTVRERALISFLAETGWAPELVSSATVDMIDRSDGVPYTIMTRRGKTGEEVLTFVGPRAARYLDAYLETRGNLPPGSPLFLDRLGKPISRKRINVQIAEAATKAGLNKKLYRGRNSFHAYALRHFFQTTLEDAQVPKNWISLMMGHVLPEQEMYSQPRVKQVREAYMKAYSKLVPGAAPPQNTPSDVLLKEVLKLLTQSGEKIKLNEVDLARLKQRAEQAGLGDALAESTNT